MLILGKNIYINIDNVNISKKRFCLGDVLDMLIKYKSIHLKKLIILLEILKKHNIKLLKNTILKFKKNPVYIIAL